MEKDYWMNQLYFTSHRRKSTRTVRLSKEDERKEIQNILNGKPTYPDVPDLEQAKTKPPLKWTPSQGQFIL